MSDLDEAMDLLDKCLGFQKWLLVSWGLTLVALAVSAVALVYQTGEVSRLKTENSQLWQAGNFQSNSQVK